MIYERVWRKEMPPTSITTTRAPRLRRAGPSRIMTQRKVPRSLTKILFASSPAAPQPKPAAPVSPSVKSTLKLSWTKAVYLSLALQQWIYQMPRLWVVVSLSPIVGVAALASVTEASFNWTGFWSAMALNLTNQCLNVLSKKVMVRKEEELPVHSTTPKTQEVFASLDT